MDKDVSPTPSMEAIPVRVPYGHACSNCVRAKRRCVLRDNAARCERCHQQWKDCSLSPVLRKDKSRINGKGRIVRSAKLVETSILSPANSSTRDRSPPSIVATPMPIPWPSPEVGDEALVNIFDDEYSTVDEAAEYLEMFKSHYIKFFPFVYIPQSITPEQLQIDRPLLWLTIKAICTKSPTKQETLGTKIRETLVKQLLIDGERNIDLLLCLLAFLAWSRYFARGKPFLRMYSDLASSLVIDLGFDRPAKDDSELASHSAKKRQVVNNVRTNEERRAFLACFMINSLVSSLMRLGTTKSWSPQIDECLQGLSDNIECPGDAVLIALSSITQVTEDAAGFLSSWPRNEITDAARTKTTVRGLYTALERIRNGLSPQSLQNKSVLNYLFSTQTLISEMVLLQRQSASLNLSLDLEEVDILNQGLLSAKSEIENYLSFKPGHYLGMDMALVLQFRHSVQMVYRLSLLEDPGWDRACVGDTVDMISCLEQAAQRLEQASEITTSTGNIAAHGVILKALRRLIDSIPTRDTPSEQQEETFPEDMAFTDDFSAEANNMLSWSTMMGCMEDDSWLTEALLASYSWDN